MKEKNLALIQENNELKRQILELKGGVSLKAESLSASLLKELKSYWILLFKEYLDLPYSFLPKEAKALETLLKTYGLEKSKAIIEFYFKYFQSENMFIKVRNEVPNPVIALGWSRSIESKLKSPRKKNNTIGY